jgi:class 3 adenylate cyclase
MQNFLPAALSKSQLEQRIGVSRIQRDGIFALFGAPIAHEDHPQCALYVALKLQDEIRRYSTKLREVGNPPIETRVGVNTGQVVVRSIATGDGHAEYSPIGHSTSLAGRMQALAPPVRSR